MLLQPSFAPLATAGSVPGGHEEIMLGERARRDLAQFVLEFLVREGGGDGVGPAVGGVRPAGFLAGSFHVEDGVAKVRRPVAVGSAWVPPDLVVQRVTVLPVAALHVQALGGLARGQAGFEACAFADQFGPFVRRDLGVQDAGYVVQALRCHVVQQLDCVA